MIGSKSVYAKLQANPPKPSPIKLQARRGEIPTYIKSIKTAQIQYELFNNTYLQCDEYPPRSKNKKTWVTSETKGFNVLNWQPDGEVRGSYSVVTTRNDFTIIGVIDADGDGTYATYTATKSTNPISPTTASDIY